MIMKSKEQISLESSKSVYMSAKEYTENVTKRIASIGEPGPASTQIGGQNTMDVMGNTVIRNLDPKGGITIQSAGYLNLVCGGERVDVTGDPSLIGAGKAYLPSVLGRATYTHMVGPSPGPNPRGAPASVYWGVGPSGWGGVSCGPGWTQNITGTYCMNVIGPTFETFTGAKTETITGASIRKITGAETVTVSGIYKLTAAMIFLN